MFKLILKTIGVMILVCIGIPLAFAIISILPVYLSSLITKDFFHKYLIALIILMAEIIGILYFIENYKKLEK